MKAFLIGEFPAFFCLFVFFALRFLQAFMVIAVENVQTADKTLQYGRNTGDFCIIASGDYGEDLIKLVQPLFIKSVALLLENGICPSAKGVAPF